MITQWLLVLTVCTSANTPQEQCNEYVVDWVPTIQECQVAMNSYDLANLPKEVKGELVEVSCEASPIEQSTRIEKNDK